MQVADPTHISTPEASASQQPQQQRSRVRRVTLRMPQPDPSGVNSSSTAPVPPVPPPPHGPPHLPPPPPQHLQVPGSQYDAHGPVMGVPPFHGQTFNTLFYPPLLPQLNFPHIPPYAAPFLSQLLAMQQAGTSNEHLPARLEAQPRAGRPALARAVVGEVDEVARPETATASSSVEARSGRTYPNKEVSTGGKIHVPSRRNVC